MTRRADAAVSPSPRSVARRRPLAPLVVAGRLGSAAAFFAAAGTLLLWALTPEVVRDETVLVVGLGLATATGAVCLVLPWERIGSRGLVVVSLGGIVLTAVAVWNSGGSGSVFNLFFLYVVVATAYTGTRGEWGLVVAATVAAAAAPLAYDTARPFGARLLPFLFTAGIVSVVGLLIQRQRELLRAARHRAEELALQDPLTGIANRRAFEQRAGAELARVRRGGDPFAVLYVDLDNFKRINDALGHAAGDDALRRVARAAEGVLRGGDVLARYGGDEFAVLLPETDAAGATRLAGRIVEAIERLATGANGTPLGSLSASVGAASHPVDGLSLEDLLVAADARLLRIKDERRLDRSRALDPVRFLPLAVPAAGPSVAVAPAPAAAPAPLPPELGALPARAAGGGLALVGAWLLAGAAGGAWGPAAALSLGALVVAVSGGRAARRTAGTERVGWILVAASLGLAGLPGVGPLGILAAAAGLLLVTVRGRLRRRLAVIDGLGIALPVAAWAVVIVVPAASDLEGAELLEAVLVTAAVVLAVSAAILVLLLCPARRRPEAWLLAGAVALAAAAALPAAVSADHLREADEPWAVAVLVAAVATALAAELRLRVAVLPPGRLPYPADAAFAAGNLALMGVLAALLVVRGEIPGEVVPLLLVVLALRQLRAHLIQRENERLVALAERSRADLLAQSRASLVALGTALEARDGYTGCHGEETVALARGVGARLGLTAAQLAELESVALLHDLGKIGIPDEILRKPGPLDAEEWRCMREHPLIGERILRTVPGLERVATAVRHEHERWDGGGYPDGLAGEDIPLSSRIVLVCDAWHATTSDRPYRAALAPEAARAELREGAGSQFDPAVVDALLAAVAPAPALDYQLAS